MTDIGPFIQRAQLLLEQGRARDAEKQLSEAMRMEPGNDIVLSLLAKCKFDLRQFDAGIDIVQKAIRIDPNEDYYYYLLAFGSYHKNNNAHAIAYLQKACSLNPYGAAYFGLWSLVLLEEKKFEEALEKANEGLALDAQELTCLNARSTALNKLKRTDDAISTMHNALAQDPENEFTHSTVAWNLLEKGNFRDSAKHFKEALRINPDLENARTGLKEALKSKLPPYKWLLQYSFWVNNKGKKARWIIPLSVFFGVRLLAGASSAGGTGWQIMGGIVLVLYFLFVATSWIINPLANFFLLYDRDGKYALTQSEKWNARLFMTAIVTGIIIAGLGFILSQGGNFKTLIIGSGCIAMSLALPLGHMAYPINLKNNSFSQWASIVLLLTGFIAVTAGLLSLSFAYTFFYVYLLIFILFMWITAFSNR